jgi:hypothetical protein
MEAIALEQDFTIYSIQNVYGANVNIDEEQGQAGDMRS